MAIIGGNLFTRHPKNLNRAHKDINDLLSVIIILGTYVHGDEKVFNYGEKINDIVEISHVLEHSRGRFVIGDFDEISHEGSICNVHRAVISFILHKSIFLHLVHNGTIFYDKYILSYLKNIYILMMMGVVFFQNKGLESYTIQNIKRLIQINIMF